MPTASDIIEDARNYASDALASATSSMGSAIAVLNNLGQTGVITTGGAPVIQPPVPGDPGEVPEYQGVHLSPDEFLEVAPILQTVPDLIIPNDPDLPPADLVYVAPLVPSGITPDQNLLTGIPTINALPTLPVMPNLQAEIAGIAAPVLVAIDIPDAPVYAAPEFTGQAPTFDAVMPTDLDVEFRSQYETISPVMIAAVNTQLDAFLDDKFPEFRTAMAAIEDRLATYLAGGTAMAPATEDALYNRTRTKLNADAQRAMKEVLGKGARAGFTMPTPMLLSQAQDVDQERRRANAVAATEIAIKFAELEQANLQFAVKTSSELRKIAMDSTLSYCGHLVSINSQALQYARDVVEFVVKAFDIAAKYAETKARIYEADAQVYRAKLEGALAVIHAYEAAVNAELAKANVNRATVDAYTARINAVKAEADVYRASVDAVVAFAGLERIKVELFDAKVKAFGSQVNAFTAQWQGYEAAVKGQSARMEVNIAHSREYEAKANGFSAIVRARGDAVKAASDKNRQLIDVYKAKVDAFAALQHSKAEAMQIDVTAYRSTIEAFIAKATAIAEHTRADVSIYEVALRGLIEEAKLQLARVVERDHLNVERAKGLAAIAQSIGADFGRVAEASLNGMNSLAATITTATA